MIYKRMKLPNGHYIPYSPVFEQFPEVEIEIVEVDENGQSTRRATRGASSRRRKVADTVPPPFEQLKEAANRYNIATDTPATDDDTTDLDDNNDDGNDEFDLRALQDL